MFTHMCTGARPCREFGKHLWVHVEGRCCVSQEGVYVCHEGVWLRTATVPAWQCIGSAGLALAPPARWHCWAEVARARGRNVGFILPFPNEPGRWNGGTDKLPVSWEGEGCSQDSS